MLVKQSLILVALFIIGAMQVIAQGPSSFEFIENKGQWDKQVAFRGQIPAGSFYLNKNGFTVVQHNADDLMRAYNSHSDRIQEKSPAATTGKGMAVKKPTGATA